MQDELDAHNPSAGIQISGINEVGFTANIDGFTAGRDMPFLQDTDTDSNNISDVWYDSWDITYRDVVVLDVNNEPVFTLNVTSSSLADATHYDALKNAFIGQIVPNAETMWQNPIERLDVNENGVIEPVDALLVINAMSDYPDGNLPTSVGNQAPYVDADGNGVLTPVDPLLVINQLTTNSIANNSLRQTPAAPLSSRASVEVDNSPIGLSISSSAALREREATVDQAMASFDADSDTVTTNDPALIVKKGFTLLDTYMSEIHRDDTNKAKLSGDEREFAATTELDQRFVGAAF